MISVFIDPVPHYRHPPTMPASVIQPARPRPMNPIDQQILDALDTASQPMGAWQLLNLISKTNGPSSRAESRAIRQLALSRLNPLLQRGLLKRIGRGVLALP